MMGKYCKKYNISNLIIIRMRNITWYDISKEIDQLYKKIRSTGEICHT